MTILPERIIKMREVVGDAIRVAELAKDQQVIDELKTIEGDNLDEMDFSGLTMCSRITLQLSLISYVNKLGHE
jgi:hypothetical protein